MKSDKIRNTHYNIRDKIIEYFNEKYPNLKNRYSLMLGLEKNSTYVFIFYFDSSINDTLCMLYIQEIYEKFPMYLKQPHSSGSSYRIKLLSIETINKKIRMHKINQIL